MLNRFRCSWFFLPLLVIFSVAACSQQGQKFFATDITGSSLKVEIDGLVDLDGKPRRLADFAGKVVVIFFGFTQCPDVCPSTMSDYAAVMKRLEQRANDVQVIFVTIDPERDTPALLKAYVPQFDARFLALTGSAKQLAQATAGLRVVAQRVEGKEAGHYSFDHTAASYVLDQQGRLRLFVRHGQPVDEIAHDLKLLLN